MNDKAVGYLFESLEGDAFTKVSLKSTKSAYKMWNYLIECYDNVDEEDKQNKKFELEGKRDQNDNCRLRTEPPSRNISTIQSSQTICRHFQRHLLA